MQDAACSRGDASHGLSMTSPWARNSTRHAAFGVEVGLQSSRTLLIRALRLSHEGVYQSIISIRAHGAEKCRFCTCALRHATSYVSRGLCVAIDVLMPFHTMTTTDLVANANNGLAKSPSEVLDPFTPSPNSACSRIGLIARSHSLCVTVPPGQAASARHATYEM